jgi:hypothetical protein
MGKGVAVLVVACSAGVFGVSLTLGLRSVVRISPYGSSVDPPAVTRINTVSDADMMALSQLEIPESYKSYHRKQKTNTSGHSSQPSIQNMRGNTTRSRMLFSIQAHLQHFESFGKTSASTETYCPNSSRATNSIQTNTS